MEAEDDLQIVVMGERVKESDLDGPGVRKDKSCAGGLPLGDEEITACASD